MDKELRQVLKELDQKVDKMGFHLAGITEGKIKMKGLRDRSRKESSERSNKG